jgi:CRISPR-associated exonuclease Cas4
LIRSGKTPPAVYQKKCDNCSLIEICLPKINKMKNADTYIDNMLTDLEQDIS